MILSFLEVIDMTAFPEMLINITRVQLAIEASFLTELVARFSCSPHVGIFWKDFYNIIDFVSAVPLLFRCWAIGQTNHFAATTSSEFQLMLGIVPVLRLLRFLRHFETFQLLLSAFKASVDALPVLIFTQVLMCLSFAAFIYYFEPRDDITSLPIAVYFVMVTLTTVGFGDISPVTTGGRICVVLLMFLGPLYMAMPIGIVGKAFGDIWEDRHRLLLMQRMRSRVVNAGYTSQDLRRMFALLDSDGNGMMDYEEFTSMLDVMQINIEAKFVTQVFESFDQDDEGSIGFDSLLRGLFPTMNQSSAETEEDED
jgi:hypothetical protein